MSRMQRWTPQEDEVLREYMTKYLGARLTDIAKKATQEGAYFYGHRSEWAVINHLSQITGRSKTRQPALKKDSKDETIKKQAEIIELQKAEIAELKKIITAQMTIYGSYVNGVRELINAADRLTKKARSIQQEHGRKIIAEDYTITEGTQEEMDYETN